MPTDAFAKGAEILEEEPPFRTEGELALDVILDRVKEYCEAHGLYARHQLTSKGLNSLAIRGDFFGYGVTYNFLTRLFEDKILVTFRAGKTVTEDAGKFLEHDLNAAGFVQEATIEALINDIAERTGFDPVKLFLAVTDGETIDVHRAEEVHLIS